MNDCYIFDKNIWITGASSGVGYEIAKALSSYKTNLILSSKNVENLTKSAGSISGQARMFAFPVDLSVSQTVKDAFEFISQEVGFPDILINNAGIFEGKAFMDTSEADFDKIITTNLKSIFNTTQCVLPAMIEAGGGAIINICSITAIKPFKYSSIYAASKAGILSMMNALREEVRKHNIKIINIIPGAIATPIWETDVLERKRHLMTTPVDIAQTVISALKLCSSQTAMIEDIIVRPQNGDF